MAIISSYGAVQALVPTSPTWAPTSSLSLYGSAQTYAALYRTQPNVRTVVDFLARNIAQLGLHVFRRLSDTDRVRLYDHGLVRSLANPNPATTRYRLFETLMQDLGVYFNAFWLKVRTDDPDRIGLVRLPPEQVSMKGFLWPTAFVWQPDGTREVELTPERVVHFRGYDPGNPLLSVSPLETLRRILAEELAASEYREFFWTNAARVEGVIQRPLDAPPWTPDQREVFRTSWQAAHAGGANSGKTAVLEDGMTWQQTGSSFRDSEFTATRKLTREECASAYHIPLPMVGILDHATFSNIREQHKQLYQDSLGPWLVMIEEEIERQLLTDFADRDRVYSEFNIQEKLKGSFEEQAASLRSLVGRPIMTPNEGRARLNLPSMDDPAADELAAPLNMANPGGDPALTDENPEQVDAQAWDATVRAFWGRQRARVQKDVPEQRAARFALHRWTIELATDLLPLLGEQRAERAFRIATLINQQTLALLRAQRPAFGADRPVPRPEDVP
jgi:HK97 family phage portal protein